MAQARSPSRSLGVFASAVLTALGPSFALGGVCLEARGPDPMRWPHVDYTLVAFLMGAEGAAVSVLGLLGTCTLRHAASRRTILVRVACSVLSVAASLALFMVLLRLLAQAR